MNFLEKKKKENPIIFDVGGNAGSSIKRFKKIFNKPIIHSFEPNKEVFKIMKKIIIMIVKYFVIILP